VYGTPAFEGRRVVVTGAAGFLGRHLAASLVAHGAEVVGLDLRACPVAGVRSVVGDVTADGPAWDVCVGADLVVHAAAIVAEAGDRRQFVAVNVGGTRQAALAAVRGGVGRFVHVSSIVVYGDACPPGDRVREDAPLQATGGPYTDTKIAAEHAVLSVAVEHGLAVTVVRPGDIYGVGSIPWVERPLALMGRGLFPLVDAGRGLMSPVHVDDVVAGVLRAALVPHAAGRVYNLAGAPVAARHFFAHHAEHLDVRLRSLPRQAVRGAASVAGVGARLAGRPLPFSVEAIEYVTHAAGYATDRAGDELGWQPTVSLDAGMTATLAAYPRGQRTRRRLVRAGRGRDPATLAGTPVSCDAPPAGGASLAGPAPPSRRPERTAT
jgi:2-alkyl-3-oxoalkanoate reductase